MEREYERVLYERKGPDGAALWLTLDNEPMRNALDDLMQRELLAIFEEVAVDNSIRAIVIGAAGRKPSAAAGTSRYSSPWMWSRATTMPSSAARPSSGC